MPSPLKRSRLLMLKGAQVEGPATDLLAGLQPEPVHILLQSRSGPLTERYDTLHTW